MCICIFAFTYRFLRQQQHLMSQKAFHTILTVKDLNGFDIMVKWTQDGGKIRHLNLLGSGEHICQIMLVHFSYLF